MSLSFQKCQSIYERLNLVIRLVIRLVCRHLQAHRVTNSALEGGVGGKGQGLLSMQYPLCEGHLHQLTPTHAGAASYTYCPSSEKENQNRPQLLPSLPPASPMGT